MSYLLDTNAVIALMRGQPFSVRSKFALAIKKGSRVSISTITAHELWYGVGKSSRPAENTNALRAFLSGAIEVEPFDESAAEAAGRIRAELKALGTPIGPYDLLIAGQAIASNATLVTANVSEFSRVSGLIWENWA